MKNLIKASIVALLSLAAPVAMAQSGLGANERVVGHTMTDEVNESGAVFGEVGTYTLGVWLGPDQLSFYAGCKVVGMRIAATVDLGRTSVFMNSIANNVMTPVKSQKQRIYSGWNNIYFNGDAYEITGEEELFVGYDYVEPENVDEKLGAIGVTGVYQDGSFYYYTDDKFYPITNVGMLCVQLIVDATGLPSHNMAFTVFDTGFKYHKSAPDEELKLYATVTNVGKEDVSEFVVGYSIDGGEPVFDTVTEDIPVGQSTEWQKSIDLPNEIGAHTVTVNFAKINGKDAPVHKSSSTEASFAVYKDELDRQQMCMEVFTDQSDYYSGLFNPVLDDMKKLVGDKVCVVKLHHNETVLAAYGTDLWWNLYAYETPVFTSDRSFFPGETSIAYCVNDYLLSMPFLLPELLSEVALQDSAQPAFANVDLSSSYDPSSRKLDITVSGAILPEAEAICGEVGLTVMLVEDSIRSYQTTLVEQSSGQYMPTTDRRYIHNDVMRTYVSDPRGTKIDASGDTYSKDFSITLDNVWKPENMRIVAYMSKVATDVNADNLKDYDIIQANSARIVVPAGIGDVEAAPAEGPATYYTLSGVQVAGDASSLASGVYIKRYADGRAEKIFVK